MKILKYFDFSDNEEIDAEVNLLKKIGIDKLVAQIRSNLNSDRNNENKTPNMIGKMYRDNDGNLVACVYRLKDYIYIVRNYFCGNKTPYEDIIVSSPEFPSVNDTLILIRTEKSEYRATIEEAKKMYKEGNIDFINDDKLTE